MVVFMHIHPLRSVFPFYCLPNSCCCNSSLFSHFFKSVCYPFKLGHIASLFFFFFKAFYSDRYSLLTLNMAVLLL